MIRFVMPAIVALCVALPGLIVPATIGASSTPVAGQVATPDAESARLLATYLDRLEAIGFRGAVLVADHDTIVLNEGYGTIDPGGEETIGPDTVFAIGSNTKPFTAAAILKLQDAGNLSVDDPIGRFLPDVPADKAGITIHHLLTHSSGLNHSGIFEGDFEEVSRDEAVRRILASELLFPPGSESSYADSSMILLAAIVELVSGRPYETFLREELFAPAGMEQTGFRGDDPALLHAEEAVGVVDGTPVGTAADMPPLTWSVVGAGGIVSSVNDLYRWLQAVEDGKILSPTARDAYASPHVPLGPDASEGYGWVVAEPMPGHRVRASAGGNGELGQQNVMHWWLDDDLVIIVSSTDASYQAEDVASVIVNILFGLPQEMPPALVPVAPAELSDYAGRYQLPDGGAIVITAIADRLLISPDGAPAFAALFPPKESETSDEQSDPTATISYLESGAEAGLDAWKKEQEATLGPFQGLTVVGSAPPEGGGEVWTYVAFEFAQGSVLTRWLVFPNGVLGAAAVPSDPPTVMLLPTSPTSFASFALGRPDSTVAEFSRDETGASSLRLTSASGEVTTATQQD